MNPANRQIRHRLSAYFNQHASERDALEDAKLTCDFVMAICRCVGVESIPLGELRILSAMRFEAGALIQRFGCGGK